MELVFLWIAYGSVLLAGIYYGLPMLRKYLGEYSVNLQDTFDRLSIELNYLEQVSVEVEEQYLELTKRMSQWNIDLKKQLVVKKNELQKKHEELINSTRAELQNKLHQKINHFKKNEMKQYISSGLKDFLEQYFLQHKKVNALSLKRVKSIAIGAQLN